MADENLPVMRVKFYGLGDLGTSAQAELAAELLEDYDPSATPSNISDVLELYNAQLFAENDFFPSAYNDEQRRNLKALIPKLRATVGRFFSTISDATLPSVVVDIDSRYYDDLLELLARHKAYERCSAAVVLPALEQTGMGVGALLANQRLVQCYDQDVRARLIADPLNAEPLISKYLDRDARHPVYLPASFTDADARALLDSYLDSADANPNFVKLIATAKPTPENRIDAKLKLKAKRKDDAWTEEFFKNNAGLESGSVVRISDAQTEPVTVSQDNLVATFSYSRRWLEDSLDYPSIFNNFLYLFEFTDFHMLLTLPSFPADLSAMERHIGVTGRDSYLRGIVFRFKDQSSFLQMALYSQFLQTQDIELESVVAWFFAEYISREFGAANFNFIPTSKTSSYLEKARHLFSEMESVIKQFTLYADNGQLDTELLTITSDQVKYRSIPSLMTGKYVYASDDQTIHGILHLLFSDQSGLTYINDGRQATSGAQLLFDNQVAYDDFHAYQKLRIDYLIGLGVLENTGTRVQLADLSQFRILQTLFHVEAVSYYHYSAESRKCIDDMVAKGWLVREESLLTHSEASYFNYYLNQAEFSDGPDLRNKYLHGTQSGGSDDRAHFETYLTALKLLIALVIKMNDEFWLRDDEVKASAAQAVQP